MLISGPIEYLREGGKRFRAYIPFVNDINEQCLQMYASKQSFLAKKKKIA